MATAFDTSSLEPVSPWTSPEQFDHVTEEVLARAADVRLMMFDVDGVLTDGDLFYSAEGETIKRFNVLDGMGIKLIQAAGIATAIITARQSPIIGIRARDLGITHVYQGVRDKAEAFSRLLTSTRLTPQQAGFIGDDLIDLPILSRTRLAVSVPDGHPEVKRRVHYITQARGGHGAAREICDLLLHAQGLYQNAYAPHLAASGYFPDSA